MKNVMLLILVALITSICISAKENTNDKTSASDYVPDEETAKKIAEAIWLPIYGERIYDEKPYVVSLVGDSVWAVDGSLPKKKRGGVAYIEIQKNDCKILKVIHSK
ncbi:YbbC/YhhH family protein [Chitinophaga pinensis]|uniref:NTF2 fold domain-containing protein n=1 Tax=Chitinophaga pinensis (strain ATCC 43595 / DSM 2588 / LMG 13176 / NBRC 15968 / NCIMB 11800 / UQM 2034) TaxID=485918 RepID=A0A979G3K4_CHIPD|nr:YbbC/YhhH family protein [Chitinophaga pinensis]ACU60190.1 hypothetical protein Cpin_2708 [Chitinophaga pinensis DSM 2588]